VESIRIEKRDAKGTLKRLRRVENENGEVIERF
jgi:hypothetical protein